MSASTSRNRHGTIDEYIASFPPDVQKRLEEIRKAIKEAAPDAQEAMAYGIPTFKLNGNLVHFAAFKHHLGFYPGGPSAIEEFRKELAPYGLSKGTIRIPMDEETPLGLVKRIVEFRVKENSSRIKK